MVRKGEGKGGGERERKGEEKEERRRVPGLSLSPCLKGITCDVVLEHQREGPSLSPLPFLFSKPQPIKAIAEGLSKGRWAPKKF